MTVHTEIKFANKVDQHTFSSWLTDPNTVKYLQLYFKRAYSSGGALAPLDEWVARMKKISDTLTVHVNEIHFPLETDNFEVEVDFEQ